jgi:hypothetical protein
MGMPPMDWGAQQKEAAQMIVPKTQKGIMNKPLEKAANEVQKVEATKKEKQKAAKELELARQRALVVEPTQVTQQNSRQASQPAVLKPPPPPPLPTHNALPSKENVKKMTEMQNASNHKMPPRNIIGIRVDVSQKCNLPPDTLSKLLQLRKWQQTLPPIPDSKFLASEIDVKVDVEGNFSEKKPPSAFIKENHVDMLHTLHSELVGKNTGMYNGQRRTRV